MSESIEEQVDVLRAEGASEDSEEEYEEEMEPRVLQVKGRIKITDDETFGDEVETPRISAKFILTEEDTDATFKWEKQVGGEVRVEISFSAELTDVSDIEVDDIRLAFYEGDEGTTDDLEEELLPDGFTVYKGESYDFPIALSNKGTGGGDTAEGQLVFRNRPYRRRSS